MIKLATPLGILLTVAVLVIYSAYAFLIGLVEDSWILVTVGVVAVIASVGTALLKPWSRWLVYALAVGFVAKLTWSIIAAVQAGFFGFQFGSPGEVVRSLLPNLLMGLLSGACCWIVYRHFAADRASLTPATEPTKANEAG
jgi:hypothetical protein